MHNLLVVGAIVQDAICEEPPGNEILQKRFGSFSLLCAWLTSETRCSVFQVELINQEKIWMDGKEFWLINEKLKQQLKVFPFRAQRGQKGAGEPVWKLNSSKSFPSLQTESTSLVSQRSRSTPLLLSYGFCQPLKCMISISNFRFLFFLSHNRFKEKILIPRLCVNLLSTVLSSLKCTIYLVFCEYLLFFTLIRLYSRKS